jgi:spermidine/putrescine transport system substrate-binding protein
MPHDPEERYSVPYTFGTTGIAVNTKHVKENADSWKAFFDERYGGRIAMTADSYDAVSAALKALGYSINTRSIDEIREAGELLRRQKKLLKGYFDAIRIRDLLVCEEIWAAEIYSGEGLSAVDKNEYVAYAIPTEGAPIWVDFFAIPRGAKHQSEAHAFIDFVLRPEVNAVIMSELWYASPCGAAKALMDPEVRDSPYVYPPAEIWDRCEFYRDTKYINKYVSAVWADLMLEE